MSKSLNPTVLPYFFNEEVYRISPHSDVSVNKQEKEKDSLTEAPATEEQDTSNEPTSSETKGMLVVLDSKHSNTDLLEKILAAVSLELKDVDLIEQKDEVSIEGYKKVILFTGNSWQALEYSPYNSSTFGEIQYLSADPLGTIAEDISLKKKLWAELKNMFL